MGCANNLAIIINLFKIGIKLIEKCMFLLLHCLNNCIIIYKLVFVHLFNDIDCYMLQLWNLEDLIMQILCIDLFWFYRTDIGLI